MSQQPERRPDRRDEPAGPQSNDVDGRDTGLSDAASKAAAKARIQQQATWVDLQVKVAMERGDFDDLPGAGKPIESLGTQHDPDWWIKQLIEREKITGVLPPSLQLRKDDHELDARLDRLASEREARAEVEDFNARVIRARYTPADGPPLITQPRDVEETVAAWRQRRAARRAAEPPPPAAPGRKRRRWWRRRSG